MGGSPPPRHAYICPDGTQEDGHSGQKDIKNCKSCNSDYGRKPYISADMGIMYECAPIYYNVCDNGEPKFGWSWDQLHYCESCNSSFYVLHKGYCYRRVDILDWGSHAPTHNFEKNGGITLSSYYYIMFLPEIHELLTVY